MKILLHPILLALMTLTLACGQENLHKPWDSDLQKYVKEGRVNYTDWRKNPKPLEGYLATLSALKKEDINALTKKAQLALYINGYNAFMVKVVLDHPQIKSVQDIKPKIWTQPIVNIGGKTMSLDALENELIRPKFKDVRIHFGVVCASVSCPPLRSSAYTEENVEAALDENTRGFLRNENENYFTGPETKISKIFEWYGGDFKKYPGGLESFLKKYAPPTYDQSKGLSWAEYNWGLNSQ